ncbi:MAG: cyclase family protein [Bifidobacteriaceae bacterium]|jgi:kynurenine formamidase|nr:cyclase family protein [Bifidobacteriaceae bacterium]
MRDLPAYDQLPVASGQPPHSAWGLWGAHDSRGTVNVLGPGDVLRATAEVREGTVFSLNWDLELPSPPFFGRRALEHHIEPLNPNAFDDYYNRFYPQASSQWDALSHVQHPEHGYYNGRTGAEFTGQPGSPNGIDAWSGGIVSRGVLLDMPEYFASTGRSYRPDEKVDIEPDDLAAAAARQGTTISDGDILLIRTGWLGWYMSASTDLRIALADDAAGALRIAGLSGSPDLPRFLWDKGVVAVATDNPTFESWPRPMKVGDYQHFDLLALLGMPIGELFVLDSLAQHCAADSRYSFMFTSAPLNKVGGIGSPPNALAIK